MMSSMESINKNDLFDSIIYGKTDSFDSVCSDKYGLHLSTNSRGKGKKHIISKPELPWHKIKDEASYFAEFNTYNVTFENFDDPDFDCNGQIVGVYALRNHVYGSDFGPLYYFYDTNFVNTIPEAIAFLDDPNPAWANADDCGDFPCTFPNNVYLNF